MRNLKRALSLAVASVMLLGMMVVGTGAYDDVTASHNEEAIAVMEAAGIMVGVDENNFAPDQKVTRNQMAVVISNLMEYKVNNYAGLAPFVDVPAWAEKYVSACYSNGIVAGVDATHYNGDATVNATQAGLMIMKVLGYFQFAADFGTDWEMAVAAKGAEIGLYDGLSVGLRTELTRDDVAQMVLNALEAVVVKGTQSGTNASISAGDANIEIYGTITYTEQKNDGYDYADEWTAQAGTDYTYLIEKLYEGRFTKTGGSDDFGLPGKVWKDTEKKPSEQEIFTTTDKATYVVVSEKNYATSQVVTAITDLIDKDYKDEDYTESMNKAAEPGDVIYFYVDNKADTFEAYVVDYELIKIGEVDDTVTKAQAEDGISAFYTYTLAGDTTEKKVADKDFAGYDYAEDDFVLAVIDGDKILASELAESFEGQVKTIKGSKLTINGTAYETVATKVMKYNDKGVFYLNKAGQIAFIDDVKEAKSTNYAWVHTIVPGEKTTNADGVQVTGADTAYVILADGTKASYPIADDETFTKGEVIAYTINKDGEIEEATASGSFSAASVALDKDNKAVSTEDGKVYADSKTEFIFGAYDEKDKEWDVTVKTGIKNVKVGAGEVVQVVYDKDSATIQYVFVKTTAVIDVDSDTMYAVVLDAEPSYTEDDDDSTKKYYTYAVATNGEETTLTFASALPENYYEGTLFAYKVADGIATEVTSGLMMAEITYVGEDFYSVEIMGLLEDELSLATGAELYTLTRVYDKAGELEDIVVAKATALSKDDTIFYALNSDGDIKIAFIAKVDN